MAALLLVTSLIASTDATAMSAGIHPSRSATTLIGGIDVSTFQGSIDWPTVDPAKVQFVIIRATKGTSYVDPSYATNLAGASGNGFVVGAYHRATPSADPGEAVAEADNFLAVARDAPGDVLPVLDIEETGGLSAAQLQDWVRAWVTRVRSTLGVRAMIYAGPNFWRTSMGETGWFARRGYPLWIAHWNVASPDVPAENWNGSGWTFWQWSATGSISGVTGDVDRDRFRRKSLSRGTISSLTVAPTAGGTVTGARIACGGGSNICSRSSNPGDTVTLTANPDEHAKLLGWTGACAAAGTSPTCAVTTIGEVTTSAIFGFRVRLSASGTGAGTIMSSPEGVDCGNTCAPFFPAGTSVTLTATADSASVFGGWAGACSGVGTTCGFTVDDSVSVGADFDSTIQMQEDGLGIGYSWARRADPRAIGGSYRWERRRGASTTFAFAGGSVTLFTLAGPAMGCASVTIDGAPASSIDGYAPTFGFVKSRFKGLGSGDHTITVTATGKRSAASADTRVGVDALRWGGTLRRTPRPVSSAWAVRDDSSADGGAYAISDAEHAVASLRFTGTGVTWITARGPSMGRAEIWVDGNLERTVDLYAPEIAFGVQRTVAGMTDTSHVVRIVVTGARDEDATGASVVLDGWIVK